MECLVCGGPAEEIDIIGDFQGWRCPECGPYRVSRTLMALLRRRSFDVEKTRDRLQKARKEYDEPTLSTYDDDLLVESGDQA